MFNPIIMMINNLFSEEIKQNFPYTPTSDQQVALETLSDFLLDRNNESLFLLKGYAGTGKSSLIGALVKTMNRLKQKTVLLAPTGRAAKVFASYSGQYAYTIHKKIYRETAFSNDSSNFVLSDNLHKHTLFLVDEASMISNNGIHSFSFGSGRLLDDLIHYVYSGENCRLLLLGDSAQLPPIEQTESPALDPRTLESYGLNVYTTILTQVVRQTEMSGILINATHLRKNIEAGKVNGFPHLKTQNYPDIHILEGSQITEAIEEAYNRERMEETIVISRSNYRANLLNTGIRKQILWREEELSVGEMLMVVKNNYFWSETHPELAFIANGDLMKIVRVGKKQEIYGFHFCDVTVHFPDYNMETELKILMETLHTPASGLSKEASNELFNQIREDYSDIPSQPEVMKKMKSDPFYNAVQVKYAYAITGHKAQGGQWNNVFLDLSYIPQEYLGMDFYRWLYTAFTRAKENIYLMNPVKELLK